MRLSCGRMTEKGAEFAFWGGIVYTREKRNIMERMTAMSESAKGNGMVQQLLERVRELPKPKGRPLLVAVDGRCASGKTTLAQAISEQTGCAVLHMDHFFLRPEQRTAQRLAQPGGNVDYERFLAEVLEPLRAGREFCYRPYDCKRKQLVDPIAVCPGQLAVVEGSYSCHPTLWDGYDLHVFLTVDPQEQLCRILRRNGPQGLEVFKQRWIPLEEKYFSAMQLQARCELVLDSSAQQL